MPGAFSKINPPPRERQTLALHSKLPNSRVCFAKCILGVSHQPESMVWSNRVGCGGNEKLRTLQVKGGCTDSLWRLHSRGKACRAGSQAHPRGLKTASSWGRGEPENGGALSFNCLPRPAPPGPPYKQKWLRSHLYPYPWKKIEEGPPRSWGQGVAARFPLLLILLPAGYLPFKRKSYFALSQTPDEFGRTGERQVLRGFQRPVSLRGASTALDSTQAGARGIFSHPKPALPGRRADSCASLASPRAPSPRGVTSPPRPKASLRVLPDGTGRSPGVPGPSRLA